MDLQDKVVIVTGAARGIGAATAELCAKNGAKVVAADIEDKWAAQMLEKVRGMGCEIEYVHTDVTKEEDVAALVKFAVDKFGRLDGIVNNAATVAVKKVADISAQEWNRVMNVNVNGVFYGCKHAVIQFLKQGGGGSIVNMGSISAVVGMPEQVVYCASKGAVLEMTRQIAIDYAKDNIRCNTIGPGSVDGEFLQLYLDGQSDPKSARDVIIGNHPINRLATPYEIADPIVFMLSDRSSFITGSNLQVDGGYSAR